MNKPMPCHITDSPADDWPGDWTIEEEMAERQRLLRLLREDDELIEDLLIQAMRRAVKRAVAQHWMGDHNPTAHSNLAVASIWQSYFAAELERYLQENI